MEQYISKSAIKAEIERRIKSLNKDRVFNHLQIKELESLLSFLDTLGVKEVDLEKEYDNEFFKDPVFDKLVNRNAGIVIAKHFYELGLHSK